MATFTLADSRVATARPSRDRPGRKCSSELRMHLWHILIESNHMWAGRDETGRTRSSLHMFGECSHSTWHRERMVSSLKCLVAAPAPFAPCKRRALAGHSVSRAEPCTDTHRTAGTTRQTLGTAVSVGRLAARSWQRSSPCNICTHLARQSKLAVIAFIKLYLMLPLMNVDLQ